MYKSQEIEKIWIRLLIRSYCSLFALSCQRARTMSDLSWRLVNFQRHVEAMACGDDSQSGQATGKILAYMAHGAGTTDLIRGMRDAGVLRSDHGVATDMVDVNKFLVESLQCGHGGNKSDACDVVALFAMWLQGALAAAGDLPTLQRLAVSHGRAVYLEFRVMGGDEVHNKSGAAVCGQWAIDMVLQTLCHDVGLSSDALLAPRRRCHVAPAATGTAAVCGAGSSTMT